jgi:hypothetical protein
VNRIVRDNGASHPLIEARKMIMADAEACRTELARAWRTHQGCGNEIAWRQAVENFRARVKKINRDIRVFNLKAPSPALHGLALDAEAEIAKIQGAD